MAKYKVGTGETELDKYVKNYSIKIPVCEPNLGALEKKFLMETIDSGWISSKGHFLGEFENEFAKFCGTKHACTACNGTTALHLAVASLGIGKGDEVIIPSFTMIATPNSIVYTGAKPILADSRMDDWNIDPEKIEKKITEKTKAIMPVHTYGHPVDMDAIKKIAKNHGLKIIEDAAESHGAEYKGKKVGSIGDIAGFSFYANKIITTGEGGMITTNSRKLNETAHTLMNHAFSKERHFWHKVLGFNYRMTNMQAAIGLAQLQRADEFIKTKRKNAKMLNELLEPIEWITTPPELKTVKNVYWMYGILIDNKFKKKDLIRAELLKAGIETRSFFIPMHQQPVYRKMGWYKNEKYPVAEELSARGFYIPSSTLLTENDIHYIVDSLKKIKK